MFISYLKRSLPGLFVLAAFLPLSSFAQSGLNTQAGAAYTAIGELVGTTTRAQSSRLTNPGNIAVLNTGDSFAFNAELLNRAAGVYINRGSGQEHLTSLRSPVLTGGAGAGSFLFMEDGISMRAAGFANVNALMDAHGEHSQRVEIVRGPGSALYGSNAMHGLVNFISRPVAIASEPTEILLRAGSYGRGVFSASTATHNGTFGYRASLTLAEDAEGYRANSGYGQQKLRLQTDWQGTSSEAQFIISATNLNQETAGYAADYRQSDIAKSNEDENAHRDVRSLRASLHLTRELSPTSRLKITPYMRDNNMEFRMHFLSTADPLEENSHKSIGVQTAYIRNTDSYDINIGIDADYTEGALRQSQTNPERFGYLPGLQYDYEVNATSLAGFVHAVWRKQHDVQITTGLRAEWVDYDYDNLTETGSFGRFLRLADRSDDFTTIAPKLGLTYQPGGGDKVYFANITRGHRAPQTSDLYRIRTGQVIEEIDAEEMDSIELGLRAKTGQWRYEVAVYHMTKENYHFRDSDNETVTNGESAHRGIEIDLDGQLTPRLDIALQASYAIHEYAFNHTPNGIIDGNEIDTAPRTLAHARLNYRLTDNQDIAARLHYVGKYYTNESNSTHYDGHHLLDVSWHWKPTQTLQLGVQVHNLLDKKYAKRADFAFGAARYFPGEPRHWSVELRRKF